MTIFENTDYLRQVRPDVPTLTPRSLTSGL